MKWLLLNLKMYLMALSLIYLGILFRIQSEFFLEKTAVFLSGYGRIGKIKHRWLLPDSGLKD